MILEEIYETTWACPKCSALKQMTRTESDKIKQKSRIARKDCSCGRADMVFMIEQPCNPRVFREKEECSKMILEELYETIWECPKCSTLKSLCQTKNDTIKTDSLTNGVRCRCRLADPVVKIQKPFEPRMFREKEEVQ